MGEVSNENPTRLTEDVGFAFPFNGRPEEKAQNKCVAGNGGFLACYAAESGVGGRG